MFSHQKMGMTFLLDREQPNPFIDKRNALRNFWNLDQSHGRTVYHNKLTDTRSSDPPTFAQGGILADEVMPLNLFYILVDGLG